MALKPFNSVGGLSVGPNVANVVIATNNGDSNVANYTVNTAGFGNVTLGTVANIHISGGNANAATLGTVTLNGDGNVTAIAISTRGDGYTIAPTITISGANSVPANATVSLYANGAIDTITINSAGTGYASGTVSASITAPSTKYLNTDGNGNLGWSEVVGTGGGGGGTPGGSNTNIQFNDNGSFGGSGGLTFDKTSNALTANGNITATNFITSGTSGNITGANVVAANTFKASTGVVVISNNGTSLQQVTIQGSTDANFAANYTLTLPVNDGSNGQALTTDGSGVLAWSNISTSSISNGNSNVVVEANANVTTSANGVANIVQVGSNGSTNGAFARINVRQVTIGSNAGLTAQQANSIAIGANAGANAQGTQLFLGATGYSIAIGANAGSNTQGGDSVAIGRNAGANNQGLTNSTDVGGWAVAVGGNAASNSQGLSAVAVGWSSGANTQGKYAVAVGFTAANNSQGSNAVAVGSSAAQTSQGANAIAIGAAAGQGSQGANGIAIGIFAAYANSTANSVYIGANAGSNGGSFANVIVLNSTGADLNPEQANGTYISSVRNDTSNVADVVYYNATTKELTYATPTVGSKIANGNSNVNIPAANGNVTISAVGNANIVVVTGTGANVAGTANITGDILAGGNVNVTSNINAAKLQNGNSNVSIAANGNVTFNASGASGALTLATDGSFILPNVLVAKASDNGSIIFSGDGANANGYIKVDGGKNMVINSEADFSIKRNGTDRITITSSNTTVSAGSNVLLAANSNTVVAITSSGDGNLQTTGGNVTGYWNVSGNVIGANLVGTLANGNSNIRIAANAGVGISSNGQGNIFAISSNGTFATTVISNDVTVTGNLTVQGNAIYANTESLTIEDPIIELGTGANGSILTTNDGKDRGLELHTYGNGASYSTSGSTPSGNTTIVLSSTSGIVAGQLVTCASDPNAIAAGTTVSTVNAGNIVISTATLATIAGSTSLAIGNDILRFMGWSNANAEFQFYSDASVTGEVVSGTLGNVNASYFLGTFKGALANGNSNISINSNANVIVTANSNTVATFTSSGDGNLATTGANVVGYVSTTGNLRTAGSVVFPGAANSNVSASTLTTTTITANQAVAKISAADGRAVEFIIKAVDSAGAKYYASTILALVGTASNADLDYSTYSTLAIGGTPGAITLALVDGNANIQLQVTPASTNSTTWTTQYRVI